ncbi:DUF4286 family protein [Acidocella sp.]|nr:DUF4286 family protein [Acidocella sp.]
MPNTLMLVFTKPLSPELEGEYNEWYSNKHLWDLTGVPGVIAATRYSMAEAFVPPGAPDGPRNYLAIYEIEGDSAEDIQRFWDALIAGIGFGGVDASATLDFSTISVSFAVPITPRVTRG